MKSKNSAPTSGGTFSITITKISPLPLKEIITVSSMKQTKYEYTDMLCKRNVMLLNIESDVTNSDHSAIKS
jgi:hypothetical protein